MKTTVEAITYTQDDFLHGKPDSLIQASKRPRILIMWPHGDERLGPRVGYHLYTKRPDLWQHVDYLCGNPRAAAERPSRGFLESDLNRSYDLEGRAPASYEEQRAREILELIERNSYDYVLDLHTSVTDVDRFIIIMHDTPKARQMIGLSPIRKVVVMPEWIAKQSMARLPQALTFEYNQDIADTEEAIKEVEGTLDRLIGNRPAEPQLREFYFVDGVVPKSEDPGLDVRNFELCRDGYYPILFGTGERSYRQDATKSYVGFAARRREEARL